jgi:hypothetical protein
MKDKITVAIMFITFLLMVVGLFAQRSPVDLRDSTETKSNVIIIRCDCTCDTIPKIDSLPI